jgi:hypothetical protein
MKDYQQMKKRRQKELNKTIKTYLRNPNKY